MDYVDGIRDTAEREAAITRVLQGVQDPALMERLYGRLTLSEQQRQAARHLFLYRLRMDPARAADYQAAAGISDAEAAEISGSVNGVPVIRSRATMLPDVAIDQAY